MAEKKFNVTRNNNGEVTGIEFNAEAFIIPNKSGKITDFWSGSVTNSVKEVATSVLGKEPDKNERYVQMWYVAKDLNCDNLADHGAIVEIDGKKHNIRLASSYLPYSILKGKNDGDVIDVVFRNAYHEWLNDDVDAAGEPITMHVTLNQKDYRYRNFGSFQETLKKVV